jgi:hypothetical protein
MDCDSCGRYRPSQEIAPLRDADGRLVMACARCRRLATGRRGPAGPLEAPTPTGTAGSAVLAAPR